jgi:hypothetical protein
MTTTTDHELNYIKEHYDEHFMIAKELKQYDIFENNNFRLPSNCSKFREVKDAYWNDHGHFSVYGYIWGSNLLYCKEIEPSTILRVFRLKKSPQELII